MAQALGMEVIICGGARKALRFGRQKINLHPAGREFVPRASRPTVGSAALCFVVEGGLEEAHERLRALGVAVEAGPLERSGALGPIRSLYLRDPDGNLIELSQYTNPGERF